jgi:GNAT superfamily N-acetyltransferase
MTHDPPAAGAASNPTLRPATPDDAEAIAVLWHDAWRDGHVGHVPEALHPHRQLEHFRSRVPPRIPLATVATLDGQVVGFTVVHEDELEQIFVDAGARGSGVASALRAHAARPIASRFPVAWLAVVEGNGRARRFYERCGWRDTGPLDYQAEIPGGTLPVPTRRYEKPLAP